MAHHVALGAASCRASRGLFAHPYRATGTTDTPPVARPYDRSPVRAARAIEAARPRRAGRGRRPLSLTLGRWEDHDDRVPSLRSRYRKPIHEMHGAHRRDGGRVRDRGAVLRRAGQRIDPRGARAPPDGSPWTIGEVGLVNELAIERPVTRRRLLATGVAGGVALLAGCGSRTQRETGWTFVDDRKRAVRLKRRPTRIVAYTTAAAALHDWGVTPVGVFGDDPREDPSLARFPWNKAQIIGSVYGEIDIEALQSLKPELIVSRWYPPPTDTPVFGFKDLKQERTIGSLVPIVGMNGRVVATTQIARFGDLAAALGVSRTSGTAS
ncbi:MAG TPA: hypothetical protein VFO24_06255, partial [Usitatibacter sp.]|nr:hypothetical protein [Usitatibacter sp.]